MAPAPAVSYVFGAFRLDPVEKVLFRDDTPVPLTPKTVETLIVLVERHGHIVTKEDLLRLVWPDTFVEDNNLAQHVSTLRRVLGESEAGGPFIETVPRRGYRFAGSVAEGLSAGSTANSVSDLQTPASSPPAEPASSARRQLRPAALAVGVVGVAAVVVSVLWHSISEPERGSSAATSQAAPRSAAAVPTRIAVLPLVNLGPPADDYFVAGMTEEITSRLAALNGLAVASGTTAAEYDRHGKNVRRIGADLGVAYVVEGSVRFSQSADGAKVRITPKLIRVADDTVAWTQQYDAALVDIFGVQADIAHRIIEALQVVLEGHERRTVEARPPPDTEAYLSYLRGVTAYQHGGTVPASLAKARAELEAAVARDPRFAVAWSWLARVIATQYTSGALRNPETRQAAERAAQTAVDLDPTLPEAHMALAAMFNERDNARALGELERARANLPNSAEVFRLIGAAQQRMGRWTDSHRSFMRGFDLEPGYLAESLAVESLHLRQYAEARRFIEIAKAANRPSIAVPEAWAHFSDRGDIAAARRVLEAALNTQSREDARVRGLLARIEWFDGRYQRALDLIRDMDPAGAWLPPNLRFPADIAAAQVYESMGRRADSVRRYEAAMATLERRQRDAPDDYQIEAALGLATAGLGRESEAIRHGERAVELAPPTRDAALTPLYLYVLAQIQVRTGRPADAFATLDRLFAVPGFYSEIWVQHDPGFAALRDRPEFNAAIDRWARQKGEALLTAR